MDWLLYDRYLRHEEIKYFMGIMRSCRVTEKLFLKNLLNITVVVTVRLIRIGWQTDFLELAWFWKRKTQASQKGKIIDAFFVKLKQF